MPICFFVPDQQAVSLQQPMGAERLLRSLGATGKLAGFRYTVYMVEQVCADASRIQLITKCLYPETAKRFAASQISVERDLQTVVNVCWRQPDHSLLEHIAGVLFQSPPSNTDFIAMLAGFLRRLH